MTFLERLALFLAIGLSLLVIGVAVIPLFKPSWTFLLPEGIKFLPQASNYYSVVGGLSAALIPIAGFYVGYLHFKKGKKHELTVYRQNRNRDFVQSVLSLINEYDNCVMAIISSAYNNYSKLIRLRHSIRQNFEQIIGFLEAQQGEAIFEKQEIEDFLRLDSLIDNNEMLTDGSYETLKDHNFESLHDSYSKRCIKVRKLCISKIVHSM